MENKKERKCLMMLILAMTVFGTVGIFSKHIPLPSGTIAFSRAFIGLVFLILTKLLMKQKINFSVIKKNLCYLIPSGIALGANWILFFLSCKTTTVPTATLSYYLAPTILVLMSFVFLKEKLTAKQIISVAVSFLGMVLASGVIGTNHEGVSIIGIVYGLLAAVLYATVVFFNKKMKDIDPIDKTIVQFFISTIALLPYVIFAEKAYALEFKPIYTVYILVMGVVHTGVAYALYFNSVSGLKSTTIAIYSYIDPILSILLSTLIFSEPINIFTVIGAVLILGASFASEVDVSKIFNKKSTDNVNNDSQNRVQ